VVNQIDDKQGAIRKNSRNIISFVSRLHGKRLLNPRKIQEKPRKNPRKTQEKPKKNPGKTQEKPKKNPGKTQEKPRKNPEFLA
jgi:hypothetical protein